MLKHGIPAHTYRVKGGTSGCGARKQRCASGGETPEDHVGRLAEDARIDERWAQLGTHPGLLLYWPSRMTRTTATVCCHRSCHPRAASRRSESRSLAAATSRIGGISRPWRALTGWWRSLPAAMRTGNGPSARRRPSPTGLRTRRRTPISTACSPASSSTPYSTSLRRRRTGAVTRSALDAGLHVYSEKPIASTMAEADALIELARERGRHLICAPAVAVTRRFRWLAEIVASDRFGRLTLAVAHHADPGPASWREYTGDPTVFYGRGVGPLVDHGIYRLHGLTMLMGAVRRVQAMGSIGIPTRVVRGGPLAGRTIEVTTPDHMLINLEFGSGAIGQLLASFGTPATQAPWLELHFERGTISFPAGFPVRPARGAEHLCRRRQSRSASRAGRTGSSLRRPTIRSTSSRWGQRTSSPSCAARRHRC